MSFLLKKTAMPTAEQALPGRSTPIASGSLHAVSGHCYHPPFPEHLQQAVFGMGCFWGAERKFWQQAGVYATAVGYAGGYTPNPTYQEVCSGLTGHAEVVLVVFDPHTVSYPALLAVFWESHNPTQACARQRRRHPVPFSHLLLRRTATCRRQRQPGCIPGGIGRRRPAADHDRNPRRAAVLLCRTGTPAISGEKPGRLLRPRRTGDLLPALNKTVPNAKAL